MSEDCALCGDPVNPYDISTWKEVAGWVGGRKKDSMTLRHDTGRYAHNHCVNKMIRGQAPDQADLLSPEESLAENVQLRQKAEEDLAELELEGP